MREEKRVQDAGQLLQQGFAAQREGELSHAIALYRKSLAAYPTPEAHTCLGSVYSEQGRFDDAILEWPRSGCGVYSQNDFVGATGCIPPH